MNPLPDEIQRFLYAYIESVDQLEILRVLGEDRSREWTAHALAAEVQGDPAGIAADLAAMKARGLLAAETRGGDVVARYGPSPAAADPVGRLLDLYKERPVTMIKMVYDRAKDPLRTLADAFRLRKEG